MITFTELDSKGRLRSKVKFLCEKCNCETIQRLEEIKRRGTLCKKCKLKENSTEEFKYKDLELTCANVLKSRMNKRYIKRGLTCPLTGNEILKLVKSKCHYCNSEPSNTHIYKQPNFEYIFYYNGIDRIDSSKGYIKGNVLSCCRTCNVAKSDMNYDRFIEHINKIYKNIIEDANI
jgi:hypothetical protein